jgi:hypothetical protein
MKSLAGTWAARAHFHLVMMGSAEQKMPKAE